MQNHLEHYHENFVVAVNADANDVVVVVVAGDDDDDENDDEDYNRLYMMNTNRYMVSMDHLDDIVLRQVMVVASQDSYHLE